jgi:ABC-type multidrug transport system ATPase subunit
VALAAALVGNPPLLLLDCPTQNVDSAARRSVWSQLAQHARRGGAILMASDAVEEVEVLCTRVAALVDGALATIGTPQQLKSRHGTTYTLQVQLNSKSSSPPSESLPTTVAGGGRSTEGQGRDTGGVGSGGGAAASREDVNALHALVGDPTKS